MSWLKKLLRPVATREHDATLRKANEAIAAANTAVDASVLARRKVLELELQLRRRA